MEGGSPRVATTQDSDTSQSAREQARYCDGPKAQEDSRFVQGTPVATSLKESTGKDDLLFTDPQESSEEMLAEEKVPCRAHTRRI